MTQPLVLRLMAFMGGCPHLTRRGRYLLLASLTGIVVGCLSNTLFLIQLSLCGLGLTCASLFLAYLNLRAIVVDNALPNTVQVGKLFGMEISIAKHAGILPAFDLAIRHQAATVIGYLPALVPNHEYRLVLAATIAPRGLYERFYYSISSNFPLGLAVHTIAGNLTGAVTAYPPPRLPASLRHILQCGIGDGGDLGALSHEIEGDLRSVREFRPGDHAKRIHWPLSARFRKMIVKELEQPGPAKVVILFHSYEPSDVLLSQRSFENALRLVAGCAGFLQEQHVPLRLRTAFNKWQPLTVSTDDASCSALWYLLATARMTKSRDLSELAAIVQAEARDAMLLLVISNSPCRLWEHKISLGGQPIICMDSQEGRPRITGRQRCVA